MSRFTVVGIGPEGVGENARAAIEGADLVAGGERHLEMFGVVDRAVELKGDLSEALARLETADAAVVLASGDPGFFGIVRVLQERFGADELLVLPAVSTAAAAFARAGLHWDDALVVSAHGREPRRAVNVCRAHHKVAVFTGPGFGPAELARELKPLGRTFLVAEKLGESDERVLRNASAAEVIAERWEDPNVVVVYDAARAVGLKGWISCGIQNPTRWALPENEFEYRSGMITKSSSRAEILSQLGPGSGDLIWDVGAGSGSVAIECARLGAAAIAVERDPESCDRIRHNAKRHAVDVQVVESEASAALENLPEPDAVFIGGTGGDFEKIVKLSAIRARRSVVLVLISLQRVIPAGKLLEDCGFEVETTFLQTSRVKGVGSMHRLAPESAVFIVTGHPA